MNKYLITIKCAIENECFIDCYDANKLALSGDFLIPRISRFKTILRTWVGRIFVRTVRCLWWVGVLVLLNDIFRGIFFKLFNKTKSLSHTDYLFICNEKKGIESARQYSQINEVSISNYMVFTKTSFNRFTDPKNIYAINLFGANELLCAGFKAFYLYYLLTRSSKDKLFRLHCALIWRVLLNCLLIDKINKVGIKKIIHTDHYDSNAIVVHQLFNGEIIQIQHGQVLKDFFPPHRIKPPAKLYTLQENASEIFTSCIYSENIIPVTEIPYSKKIEFIALTKSDFTILVASRPGDMEAEMEYIKLLRERNIPGMRILVKPHPFISPRNAYKENFRINFEIEVWQERNSFPLVDLLVSGKSTVAIDFKAHGISVLDVYDPNAIEVTNDLYQAKLKKISMTRNIIR